jgi:superfamily I DNA/RNA helicase
MRERIKINAPPGCGKTYTLIAKYNSLINSEGYSTKDITCTTFRKSSALDLISRIVDWTGEDSVSQNAGTLHSICYRLLGTPQIINAKDIHNFSKEYRYSPYMQTKALVTDEEEAAYSGKLFDLYTWMKNTQTPLDKWYKYPGADNVLLPTEKVPEFFLNYEKYKQTIEKIDFSDMIEYVLKNQISLDTPVLLVDEFQDLTQQQYELFKMWADQCDSVTVAGDPFQSIYGFWGGNPAYFKDWKAKEIICKESHRLLTPIWELAVRILKNEYLYPPNIQTKATSGKHISLSEWNKISLNISDKELHLVRCNYQAGPIAMQLAKSGRVFGGLEGWTDEEIRLFNAILKARTGSVLLYSDMIVLIKNYPGNYFKYRGKKGDFIKSLQEDYTPTLLVMNPYIKPELDDIINSEKPASYIANCGELKKAKINGIIHRKTPITNTELRFCRLLTIHGAKGLEADTVFLHTAITPRIRKNLVIPGEESAAEARVWYVGVTRAKNWLYIVHDVGYNYPFPEAVI